MPNKVLLAFIGADILFAVAGAIMMAFSVIVQNTCFAPPTEGEQAARHLMYQKFPLTGRSMIKFLAEARWVMVKGSRWLT